MARKSNEIGLGEYSLWKAALGSSVVIFRVMCGIYGSPRNPQGLPEVTAELNVKPKLTAQPKRFQEMSHCKQCHPYSPLFAQCLGESPAPPWWPCNSLSAQSGEVSSVTEVLAAHKRVTVCLEINGQSQADHQINNCCWTEARPSRAPKRWCSLISQLQRDGSGLIHSSAPQVLQGWAPGWE